MLLWAGPFRAAPHQVDEAAKVFVSWADQVCSDLSPEVQRDGRGGCQQTSSSPASRSVEPRGLKLQLKQKELGHNFQFSFVSSGEKALCNSNPRNPGFNSESAVDLNSYLNSGLAFPN